MFPKRNWLTLKVDEQYLGTHDIVHETKQYYISRCGFVFNKDVVEKGLFIHSFYHCDHCWNGKAWYEK